MDQWNAADKVIYNYEQDVGLNYKGGPFFNLPPWMSGGIAAVMLTPYIIETIDICIDIWDYYFPEEEDKITTNESNESL